ncbi:hypothetical protein GCM10011390_16260 [Aureimonas endophytica]|uniref:Tlde1 domain-containing protein n=1 Tax=Aureimonas endophytica TaxID=2027858 RepID=A0A916ZH83_9HYPH|nr:DUF2778 domain-containing protein [Aureimonas endophytica]GGD98240.1 hypothetical protein GCM10011390_16260 [Aureimonas endophytica]
MTDVGATRITRGIPAPVPACVARPTKARRRRAGSTGAIGFGCGILGFAGLLVAAGAMTGGMPGLGHPAASRVAEPLPVAAAPDALVVNGRVFTPAVAVPQTAAPKQPRHLAEAGPERRSRLPKPARPVEPAAAGPSHLLAEPHLLEVAAFQPLTPLAAERVADRFMSREAAEVPAVALAAALPKPPVPQPAPVELASLAPEPEPALVPPAATAREAIEAALVPTPSARPAYRPIFSSRVPEKTRAALPSENALAYARPDAGDEEVAPRRAAPFEAPRVGNGTAVYDISAATVYMPNGERLEAHSGLGAMRDNPRFVHQKMRGPTPPHTYNLTMRESRFHGVEAIRLHPIGGERQIYNRVGLLAHTYMLGKRGDSNGCVSFKDYNRFLAAFKRGDVRRLVVVERMSNNPISRLASLFGAR